MRFRAVPRVALSVILLVLTNAGALAGTEPSVKSEVNRLQKATFRKTLLARQDILTSRPERVRLAELPDGSYYKMADPAVGFEELAQVMVSRLSVRKDGKLLLATLEPPAYIVPPHLQALGAPRIGASIVVELDVEAHGGVEQALRSLVYLPGEVPGEDAVARCLARYPDHEEKQSRLRCGIGDAKAREGREEKAR